MSSTAEKLMVFAASVYIAYWIYVSVCSFFHVRPSALDISSIARVTTSTEDVPEQLKPKKDDRKRVFDFVATFPPSRRHALSSDIAGIDTRDGNHGDLLDDVPNDSPEAEYITPTGFTSTEIRQLGNFPDYATLSGVPLPSEYVGFDIDRALPRPYRPFRWPYHQTMALAKLDPNWWIELENTYRNRIAQRCEIFQNVGKDVLQSLPGSEMQCKELMEMVLQFLCARYPNDFELSCERNVLINRILNTSTDLRHESPLLVLLENVPEDFAVMIRNPRDGLYYLRAGIICSAVGFSLGEKIGMPLQEIHDAVPKYDGISFSMNRFFAKLPTEHPIQRGSWSFELGEPLFVPPGDDKNIHRSYQKTQSQVGPSWKPPDEYGHVSLRVDWQTLRRLPLTGAIVFNFKALFTPVIELRNEPYIPELCHQVLVEGSREIYKYKGLWYVEHLVIPWLKQWSEEQTQSGLMEKDWAVSTLADYPWYQGWVEKWQSQQGFDLK